MISYTPFRAPEMFDGVEAKSDKTDVRSMGAVFYEMLTGGEPLDELDEGTLKGSPVAAN